ncbi:unnamed protein product [Vitrella brassicaformis CCMP3155]|uniref:Polymerase nucleotidyl transferase domain-containing protein n=2 Tax=Vitrella brassicaformis TaxID=1169539 RepID=A0A0G4H0H7_VITBC|nr:unnamed protein product [Vitrella brassicaformis CCMP3155]|eukprot:CEM36833.1 unnamed protein product [Vitrella brassicaformis CCMP3155]
MECDYAWQDVLECITPTPEEREKKEELLDCLRRFTAACLDLEVTVEVSGSTAWGVETRHSDLDVVLLVNDVRRYGEGKVVLQTISRALQQMRTRPEADATPLSVSNSRQEGDGASAQHGEDETTGVTPPSHASSYDPLELLRTCQCQFVESARVPILSLRTESVICDVSVNTENSIRHTAFFQSVLKHRPGLRQVMRLLKQWMKARRLPGMKDGGLPSICWMLLAVTFCDTSANHEGLASQFTSCFRRFGSREQLTMTISTLVASGSHGTVQLTKDLDDVAARILSPQNHGGVWDELTTIEDPAAIPGADPPADLAARVSAATWLVYLWEIHRVNRLLDEGRQAGSGSAITEVLKEEGMDLYTLPSVIADMPPADWPGMFGVILAEGYLRVVRVERVCVDWETWWSKDFVSRRDVRSVVHGRLYSIAKAPNLGEIPEIHQPGGDEGGKPAFSLVRVSNEALGNGRGVPLLFSPCQWVCRLEVMVYPGGEGREDDFCLSKQEGGRLAAFEALASQAPYWHATAPFVKTASRGNLQPLVPYCKHCSTEGLATVRDAIPSLSAQLQQAKAGTLVESADSTPHTDVPTSAAEYMSEWRDNGTMSLTNSHPPSHDPFHHVSGCASDEDGGHAATSLRHTTGTVTVPRQQQQQQQAPSNPPTLAVHASPSPAHRDGMTTTVHHPHPAASPQTTPDPYVGVDEGAEDSDGGQPYYATMSGGAVVLPRMGDGRVVTHTTIDSPATVQVMSPSPPAPTVTPATLGHHGFGGSLQILQQLQLINHHHTGGGVAGMTAPLSFNMAPTHIHTLSHTHQPYADHSAHETATCVSESQRSIRTLPDTHAASSPSVLDHHAGGIHHPSYPSSPPPVNLHGVQSIQVVGHTTAAVPAAQAPASPSPGHHLEMATVHQLLNLCRANPDAGRAIAEALRSVALQQDWGSSEARGGGTAAQFAPHPTSKDLQASGEDLTAPPNTQENTQYSLPEGSPYSSRGDEDVLQSAILAPTHQVTRNNSGVPGGDDKTLVQYRSSSTPLPAPHHSQQHQSHLQTPNPHNLPPTFQPPSTQPYSPAATAVTAGPPAAPARVSPDSALPASHKKGIPDHRRSEGFVVRHHYKVDRGGDPHEADAERRKTSMDLSMDGGSSARPQTPSDSAAGVDGMSPPPPPPSSVPVPPSQYARRGRTDAGWKLVNAPPPPSLPPKALRRHQDPNQSPGE